MSSRLKLGAEGREIINKVIELRDLVKKYYPETIHISAATDSERGYVTIFGMADTKNVFDLTVWEGTDKELERIGD